MEAETRPPRRQVLIHGGIYAASRVLNQGVVFLLLPLYAHLLGPEGVGVVEVMLVARAFLGVIFTQGLDAAWFRLRFDSPEADDVRELESTLVWSLKSSRLAQKYRTKRQQISNTFFWE